MSISVFLSTVSDEFRLYRDQLAGDLTRHNVSVKVQEDFIDLGGDTLDKLDVYIAHCDAVVHLVGEMTGAAPQAREVAALRRKYPDLTAELPPLAEALRDGDAISYTQWEAWLALYHGKLLLTAIRLRIGLRRFPAAASPCCTSPSIPTNCAELWRHRCGSAVVSLRRWFPMISRNRLSLSVIRINFLQRFCC